MNYILDTGKSFTLGVCRCGCGKQISLRSKDRGQLKTFENRHNLKLAKRPIAPHGEKCRFWKGGRVLHSNGYIKIQKPGHPYATYDGYVYEHRWLMEQKIGRYLRPDEDVHHKNHVKTDNRIENLELLPQAVHRRLHGGFIPGRWDLSNRFVKEWRQRWRWLFNDKRKYTGEYTIN